MEDTARAIAALITHDPNLNRTAFYRYCDTFGVAMRQPLTVSYQPRIKSTDRAQFEAKLSASVGLSLAGCAAAAESDPDRVLSRVLSCDVWKQYGHEVTIRGLAVPSAVHEEIEKSLWTRPRNFAEYYPIAMMYPVSPQSRYYYGYDFLSDEHNFEALEFAITSGSSVTSTPILVASEGWFWVPVYVPIYNGSLPISTSDERRNAIIGLVSATIESKRFLNYCLASTYRPLQMRVVVCACSAARSAAACVAYDQVLLVVYRILWCCALYAVLVVR